MAKTETPTGPVEITPGDSAVPVWLVPLTPEEEAERAQWAIEAAEREQAETERAAARHAALRKLAALGLAADEIAAITN